MNDVDCYFSNTFEIFLEKLVPLNMSQLDN